MSNMEIKGSVVLVTGANRGIGRAFVETLKKAGAERIYAAARDISSVDDLVADDPERVVPVALDITDPEMVRDAAERCSDINLLVNNAGIAGYASFIDAESIDAARSEMETNYFGTLAMCRAFAPVLADNGAAAIINIISILGLVNLPMAGSYCASKAALHSMTQGIRAELTAQGTQVVGVYPGPVDTDMTKEIALEKAQPARIAEASLKAVTDGVEDVFPDEMSAGLHKGLIDDPKGVEKQMADM